MESAHVIATCPDRADGLDSVASACIRECVQSHSQGLVRSAPAMTWPGWAPLHQFPAWYLLVCKQIPCFQQQFIVETVSHLSSVSSYMIVWGEEKKRRLSCCSNATTWSLIWSAPDVLHILFTPKQNQYGRIPTHLSLSCQCTTQSPLHLHTCIREHRWSALESRLEQIFLQMHACTVPYLW